MLFTLTLAYEERKAIDWVGYRYAHGDDLYDVLLDSINDEEEDWEREEDITFRLEEWQGEAIYAIGDESDFRWDCFTKPLIRKLASICDQVVELQGEKEDIRQRQQ